MEKIANFDYTQLVKFLNQTVQPKKQGITKEELKQLFKLTKTESERECIRYAIYKSSGATQTEACRLCMGF